MYFDFVLSYILMTECYHMINYLVSSKPMSLLAFMKIYVFSFTVCKFSPNIDY